jgi:hypothetical protein
MEGGFLLNVVVGRGCDRPPTVSQRRSSIVGREGFYNGMKLKLNPVSGLPFLVLDLGLHIVNCVRRLHLKRDGLSGQSLNKKRGNETQLKMRENEVRTQRTEYLRLKKEKETS